MSDNKNMNFSERLQMIIEEDVLIEHIKNKSNVPKPVIRQIVVEVGANLPKIYNKLYDLGYAIRITDFRKKSDKLPRSVAARLAAFKPFRFLLNAMVVRSGVIQ